MVSDEDLASNDADADTDVDFTKLFQPVSGDKTERLPLVHLSYDITSHLKAKEIPSPTGFHREVLQILA